jgi:hypothetical protein
LTLEDFGNLGEVIGAIAVVISLVYLAVQIRQNTRMVRASAEQAVFESGIEFDRTLVSDPELTRIWHLGRSNPDELTKEEARRFRRLMSMLYRNFENLYFQHQKALVDDHVFAVWREGFFIQFYQQPGVLRWWESYGGFFTEEFRGFVERERAT